MGDSVLLGVGGCLGLVGGRSCTWASEVHAFVGDLYKCFTESMERRAYAMKVDSPEID